MSLTIKKTIETPFVHLEKGLIKLEGRSLPENVLKFYGKVDEWIDEYVKAPESFTRIDLHLTYLSSCSSKHISDLLKKLNTKYLEGYDMKVFWTYEEGDDSTMEAGDDLESMIDIPFEYVVTASEVQVKKRLKVKNLLTGKIGEISQNYWETILRNGHAKDFKVLETNEV